MSNTVQDPTLTTAQPAGVTEPTGSTSTPQTTTADTNNPVDPVTGYSSTSNGNQIAVLSTIDYSTNTITYTYNYISVSETNNTTTHYHDSSSAGNGNLSTGNTSSLRNGNNLRFESQSYFRSQGKARVDRVMGFSITEGGIIELSRRAFRGIGDLEFESVSSRRELKRATKSNVDIIYHESASRLYFNANGEENGFGTRGGLFAILEGAPQITANHITLI